MPLLVSQTYANIILQPLAEGTIIADGTEDVLVEAYASEPFRVMGYVDLCNLVSGDRVLLREYMVIKKGGEYRLYDTSSYEGEQEKPLIYIESKESSYGIKITIHHEAGDPQSVDFQFFKTKV